MRIIEALKMVKDLQRKADDLKELVKANCSLSTMDTPKYGKNQGEQAEQVRKWIQAHTDIVKEICKLRVAIQKTKVLTRVEIELGGVRVSKTIAEWIHRRRDLAAADLDMWSLLTDRGIREGTVKSPSGEASEVKIVRFYDPAERDKMRGLYSSEPSIIDGKLEIINAITNLVE